MTIASQTLSALAVGKRETNPDLAFTTTKSAHTNYAHRIVPDLFPRSIITHDALIKPTLSAPILRWNFRKAHFTKGIFKLLSELPDPNTLDIDEAYCQFISAIIKTAKQHIPRYHRNGTMNVMNWQRNIMPQH